MTHCPRKATARRAALVVLLGVLILGTPTAAAPPPASASRGDTKSWDYWTCFGTDSLLMFVGNLGSFAYDAAGLLSPSGGLHYPRGSGKTMIYAGGLWIGARMGKGVRVSAAEYAFDYVPGPMVAGTYQTDRSSFHVYKISRGDTPLGNPDYRDWPFVDGAPAMKDYWGDDSLDSEGRRMPLLLGDQTLWAVGNDANGNARNSDPGSPLPLGVEVQTLAWGFNVAGPLGRTVFMRYTIINNGDSTLRDAHLALWSDPDLGDPTDDLVGCDTSLSLGFCYNSGPDAVYGSAPPAVGYLLLRGPRVGFPDRSLRMTAFSGFATGSDPNFALAAYYLMQGLSVGGEAVIDPVTGRPTTYTVSGDPVSGSGWLDVDPVDRRFLVSAGPFTMMPGDTQVVDFAILVGQGTDRLASVTSLREGAVQARQVYDSLSTRPVIADVDILPQQCPNTLEAFSVGEIERPRSAGAEPHGDLPVAITGSEAFDVSAVDASSLALEGVAPVAWRYEDLSAPITWRESPCDCRAGTGDGVMDLVLEFRRTEILTAVGPLTDHQTRPLVLAGRLRDGQGLAGKDCATVFTHPAPGTVVPPARETRQRIRTNPNPFNAATTISYVLKQAGPVHLGVYDILGRQVNTLADAWLDAGTYEATWNGDDKNGRVVPSGLYLVRLTAGGITSSAKMILLK